MTIDTRLFETPRATRRRTVAELMAVTPRALPQPFPYQGSKRGLIREILSLFPAEVDTLWEPFAGSAAVSVAASKFGLANHVVISDVNAPLMGLWELIINSPEDLIAQYKIHWESQLPDPKAYYESARQNFNSAQDPATLLYLLCRCVKAAVRYNQRTGAFNQSADHRRLGAKPASLAKRILETSAIMEQAEVQVADYKEALLNAKSNDLVYLDPPYQGTSGVPDHRYLRGLSRDNFIDALEAANDRGVAYLLSYDALTDDNKYGEPLPQGLDLLHLNVAAGTSSQGTLSGKRALTYESIYVSPAATARLGGKSAIFQNLVDLGQLQLERP